MCDKAGAREAHITAAQGEKDRKKRPLKKRMVRPRWLKRIRQRKAILTSRN